MSGASWTTWTELRDQLKQQLESNPNQSLSTASGISRAYSRNVSNWKSGLANIKASHDAEMAKPNPDPQKIARLQADKQTYETSLDRDQRILDIAEIYVVYSQQALRAQEEVLQTSENVELSPINANIPGVVGMADSGDEQLIQTVGDGGYNREGSTIVSSSTSPTGWIDQETGLPVQRSDVTEVSDVVVTGTRSEMSKAPSDHRVRIKPLNTTDFYGPAVSESNIESQSNESHLLRAIQNTNGVIFPYTPTITYSHQVNYTNGTVVHANQDYLFYNNTSAVQFQLSAKFSVQNDTEAEYYLAAKHFFSTAAKMFFGDTDEERRGLPPPILIFSGYGDLMINNLPVVMNNFIVDLPDDVDYVDANVLGTTNQVPSLSTFQLTFTVQNTPVKQRSFNFGEFASGNLLKSRGWI